MPYWRNRLTAMGMIADTFETAITWDKFPALYKAVKSTMESALREITQRPFSFSCRFTHVYPDGPAPYFTFYCVGDTRGDLSKALEKWKQLKRISMDVLAEQGATVTHHHAVGRDHRFGYEKQTSPLFRQTLAAGKKFLDPHGIYEPARGNIFPACGRRARPSSRSYPRRRTDVAGRHRDTPSPVGVSIHPVYRPYFPDVDIPRLI